MKYIALLLIVANVGFFFFHDEIVQKPAQIETMPLPKDVPQLKLVKEINHEPPKTTVAIDESKKPENPIIETAPVKEEPKIDQIVAVAQPTTVSQEDPVKIASQAFDVLKTLKNEADRMTSSIDQAVSTPSIPTNPPETQPKTEPPKIVEKTEKIPETPKTPEKTIVAEQKPVEETKVKIPAKPVETKIETKPIIEKVEPVKIVEKPIISENIAQSSQQESETSILEEVDPNNSTDKLPITLAASKKDDKKNKKNCYYSGVYEKKFEAAKAKAWLEKQKVSSKVKDWKNRVKSGKTVFLPAASHEVAKKLLKRLALKKIKDYSLVRNEKGGYLINLGSFRTEKTLQNRLSELKKKGFVGLKVQDRYLDIPVFRLKIEATSSQRNVLENYSLTFKVPKPQPTACEN